MEYKNIQLIPQRSVVNSRSECSTTATLGDREFIMPVIPANMKSIMSPKLYDWFISQGMFAVYHKYGGHYYYGEDAKKDVLWFVEDNQDSPIISISVGIDEGWQNLVLHMFTKRYRVDYFTIDVAYAFNNNVIPICDIIRKYYPNSFIILGNGATGKFVEWVESLNLADAVKVGIGRSPSCRTKEYTGYSSDLNDLIECVQAAKNVKVIMDGGLTVDEKGIWYGDIAKALVLGADWVMSGAIFANCTDSPARENYFGNASEQAKGGKNVEGATIQLPPSDLSMLATVARIKESLQSSISYCGGKEVVDLYGRPYKIV